MSSSLELCLFRHGRTFWNALGKYQGHADVDLDELGRRQAVMVGRRVSEMKPTAIYSSDLRRCMDTVAQVHGGIKVIPDQRLRERDVGSWSGQTRDQIRSAYPDDYKLWMEGSEVRPGGGETTHDVLGRVRAFLDFVVDKYQHGTVVAVSHGGWIKVAAQWVLLERADRMGLGVVSQGSLTVFSYSDGAWRLEAYNDRGHLLDVEAVDQEPPAPAVY